MHGNSLVTLRKLPSTLRLLTMLRASAIASLACIALSSPLEAGNTYYVAPPPTGDDRNPGDSSGPWATPSIGVSRLEDGDTLVITFGQYDDAGSFDITKSDISIIGLDESGASNFDDPMRGPLIDGSPAGLREIGNDLWERYEGGNSGGSVWRTKAEYDSTATADDIGGRFEFGGRTYQLIRYSTGKAHLNLLTKDQRINPSTYFRTGGPLYCGPGVFYDKTGVIDGTPKRIYIRLDQTEMMQGLDELPSDPRRVAIYISDSTKARIEINRYGKSAIRDVRFQGLRFRGFPATSFGKISGLTFDRCVFDGGLIWLRAPDEGADPGPVLVTNCRFLHSFPDYVAWNDVKRPSTRGLAPARWLEAAAITVGNGWHDVLIQDCVFDRAWDGVFIYRASNVTVAGCSFLANIDDCIQLCSSAWNVCIAHNHMIGGAPAIGRTGDLDPIDDHGRPDPSKVGTKWIHHNLIHIDRSVQRARMNFAGCFQPSEDIECCPEDCGSKYCTYCEGTDELNPFGYHKDRGFGDYGDPWNLFNNTVIYSEKLSGARSGLVGICPRPSPETAQHLVYNNIIVQMTPDAIIEMEGLFTLDDSMYSDGNQYYRVGDGERRLWGGVDDPSCDGTGKRRDFWTIDQLRDYSGWEQHGIYGNPQLHMKDSENPDVEYAPEAHTRCASCFVDIPEVLSPCGDGGIFRGALPPIGGCSVVPGDADCDGVVTFEDIDPFITALFGRTDFCEAYPECLYQNADTNCDGEVDFDDITPFVERLSGGWRSTEGCP